jgi:hypothetical protein
MAEQGYWYRDTVDLAELAASDVFAVPIGIGAFPSQTVNRPRKNRSYQ